MDYKKLLRLVEDYIDQLLQGREIVTNYRQLAVILSQMDFCADYDAEKKMWTLKKKGEKR